MPAPAVNPLTPDELHRRLVAQGYKEDAAREMVRIHFTRHPELPAPPAQPTPGVMSNALSSIVAVAGHARALVPTFRADFVTVFSPDAQLGARVGAFVSLVMKLAVIAILAYAGLQEWKQHIISNTAIADAEARKRHAEECQARLKVLAKSRPYMPLDVSEDQAKLKSWTENPAFKQWLANDAAYRKDCLGS